ncbi:MAG: hypothetical protein GIW99_00110, partial [Candidatus Eremiobacteraeota bacterium]|nr:hypothetical protein [Candidatus Eremiobacteraeota bacterium]
AVTFEHTWNGIIVTERVKRIIDIAASNKGRSTLIAPIDLLQAMITEGRGIAARVLADLAVGAASTGRT